MLDVAATVLPATTATRWRHRPAPRSSDSAPASGTLDFNANGTFTYTPVANANGSVTFTYHASDGSPPSSTAM